MISMYYFFSKNKHIQLEQKKQITKIINVNDKILIAIAIKKKINKRISKIRNYNKSTNSKKTLKTKKHIFCISKEQKY